MGILDDLFEYNHHVNQRLITHMIDSRLDLSEKSLALLNHIVNAHHIWLSRILKTGSVVGVWDVHDLESTRFLDHQNYEATRKVLRGNAEELIRYTNTKGETYTNAVQDMLLHIVNHATYHRGQIATDFTLHDIQPLITDYIIFKRSFGV